MTHFGRDVCFKAVLTGSSAALLFSRSLTGCIPWNPGQWESGSTLIEWDRDWRQVVQIIICKHSKTQHAEKATTNSSSCDFMSVHASSGTGQTSQPVTTHQSLPACVCGHQEYSPPLCDDHLKVGHKSLCQLETSKPYQCRDPFTSPHAPAAPGRRAFTMTTSEASKKCTTC